MNFKFFIYLIIICACVGGVASCVKDDSWTTEKGALLSFSPDTIVFDTLISTIPAPTKTLTVTNNNKDGLRITQVRLLQGTNSPFRVNVDGEYLPGGQGSDFEVRGRDSMVVRIEVTLPVTGQRGPVGFQDDLEFLLESGVAQRVRLTAGAQDARFMRGEVFLSDTTLNDSLPIVIYDSLVVGQGAVLTLQAGTVLMFHDKASFQVYGTLKAEGTVESPVILRGDRTDHMFANLYYDNTPSRWEGLHIHAGSYNNRLINTDLHSGCFGILCDSTSLEEETLFMENCVLHNIGGDGLALNSCKAVIRNTQVSNTLGHCVMLFGGEYVFEHCTLAQFYPFTAERGMALYVANREGDNYRELRQAHFLNCVITGYGDDVILGSIEEGQDEPCNYLFQNCFLNTVESDDDQRFVAVRYDHESDDDKDKGEDELLLREKNFRLFNTTDFLYDFTPDSLSRIRNMADPEVAARLPLDRLGRSRFLDEAPDAGCYEYVDSALTPKP